ncbi:ketopantoate reductase family protein [Priestia filamentosa]|uniref:ketopantoate reductase family protein n=1 Tax=Priestia filamentosa TaxID=1402861 RepID=UPI00031C120F|nr:ketopantoate reductase family protein [Priestia filamentosa]
MKILVVGAGGVGGYFGARLAESGEDVTFLVREKRAKRLREDGLVVKSIHGDIHIQPSLVTKETPQIFDVVLLSTKAYHLQEVMEDLTGFVGEETVIVPLLNGFAHVEQLEMKFGAERVSGGLCFIETTLNEHGHIIQTSGVHKITFGERTGVGSERMDKLEQAFAKTKAMYKNSDRVLRDMWNKYLFITTLSSVTTLTRAPIGAVLESKDGEQFVEALMIEIKMVMDAIEAPLSENIVQRHMETMHKQDYGMKSSMQRDMEKELPVEGDHLQGYLLQKAKEQGMRCPYLEAVYQNLKVYEVQKNKRSL